VVRTVSPIQRTNLVRITGYLLAKKLPNFCARMSENGNTFFYTKTAIITMLLNSLFLLYICTLPLKVDGNKKQWGPGRRQMLGNGLGPWRSSFIFNFNMQFLG
jgi:hypothetical protein